MCVQKFNLVYQTVSPHERVGSGDETDSHCSASDGGRRFYPPMDWSSHCRGKLIAAYVGRQFIDTLLHCVVVPKSLPFCTPQCWHN